MRATAVSLPLEVVFEECQAQEGEIPLEGYSAWEITGWDWEGLK